MGIESKIVQPATAAGAGTGDVLGPGASTDNALCRWDGTGGTSIKDSGTTLSDTGVLTLHATTGRILAPDGSAADPAYSFANATGFGMSYDENAGNPLLTFHRLGSVIALVGGSAWQFNHHIKPGTGNTYDSGTTSSLYWRRVRSRDFSGGCADVGDSLVFRLEDWNTVGLGFDNTTGDEAYFSFYDGAAYVKTHRFGLNSMGADATASGAGRSLTVHGGTTSDAAENGGDLILAGGDPGAGGDAGEVFLPAGGVPATTPATHAGFAAIRVDEDNDALYIYTNGAWNEIGAGGGGITAPGTTVSGNIVTWDSTTGAAVEDSGVYLVEGLLNGATGDNVSLLMGRNADKLLPASGGNTVAILTSNDTGASQGVGSYSTYLGANVGEPMRLNSSGTNNVAIGAYTAAALNTAASQNTLVGARVGLHAFNMTGSSNTAYGYQSAAMLTSGTENITIGISGPNSNLRTGSSNILIGYTVEETLAATNTSSTLVIGHGGTGITDGYFGAGMRRPVASIGTGFTFHPTEPTETSNASAAAAPLKIAGGRGTGTGTGSSVIIQTAPAGGSGSTHNALVDRLTVTQAGEYIFHTTKTPSSASDTGTTGTIAWDSSFIYVCTTTDTWKRAAIATW